MSKPTPPTPPNKLQSISDVVARASLEFTRSLGAKAAYNGKKIVYSPHFTTTITSPSSSIPPNPSSSPPPPAAPQVQIHPEFIQLKRDFSASTSTPFFSTLNWLDRQIVHEWRSHFSSPPLPPTKSQFQNSSTCSTCSSTFNSTNYRHHCRCCLKVSFHLGHIQITLIERPTRPVESQQETKL